MIKFCLELVCGHYGDWEITQTCVLKLYISTFRKNSFGAVIGDGCPNYGEFVKNSWNFHKSNMFCQEPDRGRNRVLPTGVIRPGITSYRSGSNTYPLVLEYRCIVKISRIFHKSNVSSRIQPEADPDITNCRGTLRDHFLSIWLQRVPSRSRV